MDRIAPGDVQVLLCAPEEQDETDRRLAFSLLDGVERDQAARLVFAGDRLAYALAHGLLRLVLSRSTGSAPAALRFTTGPHGRPELVQPPGRARLCFSLSHTAGLVGCAIATAPSAGLELGFDLEAVRDEVPAELAEAALSPGELEQLRRQPDAERSGYFHTLWTLKEAYLKARGLGLSIPPRSFSIHEEASGWALRSWRLPSHCLSLASRPAPAAIRLWPGVRLRQLAVMEQPAEAAP